MKARSTRPEKSCAKSHIVVNFYKGGGGVEAHLQKELLRSTWGLGELIDVPPEFWVEKTEFKESWTTKEQAARRSSHFVVIDGATWAASDIPLNSKGNRRAATVFSGDGENFGLYTRQRSFAVHAIEQPEKEGEPQTLVPLVSSIMYDETNIEEDLEMSTFGDDSMSVEELEKLKNELNQGTPGGNLTPSEEFNGDGAGKDAPPAGDVPAVADAPSDLLPETVRAFLNTKKPGNADAVHIFNQTHGEALGWIVGEEARIEPTLRAIPKLVGGQKQLEDSATAEIRDRFKVTGTAPMPYLKKNFLYGWRQTTPGPIEAGIFRIPLGGLVDFLAFRESEPVMPNAKETTLVTQVIPYKAVHTFLSTYFRRGIKESKATHTTYASQIRPDSTTKQVQEEKGIVTRFSRKLIVDGRRTLIIPGNHLPIRVYEKVKIDTDLTQEQVDLLNKSAFGSLLVAKYGSRGTKINFLHDDELTKVTHELDAEGRPTNVSSVYITQDVANRVAIEVKPYYGEKNDRLEAADLFLPVKMEYVTSKGVTKAKYIKYSAVDKNVLDNPNLVNKTSLNSGEYAEFIKAVGEEFLNINTLRDLTSRRSPKSKIGQDLVSQLEYSIASGELQDSSIAFDKSPEELREVNNLLYQISQSAHTSA